MNKNILKIHLDILDNTRQELLQKIIPNMQGFVLGGGTALALQLAHRKSFDFDFFSFSPVPKGFLEKLSKDIEIGNIAVDTSDELTFFTKDNIKVTFLHYPFEPHFKTLALEDGLSIFPVQEIALQKAYTVGRRGEYRDYFDLYFILKDKYINLNEIITGAKGVYGNVFDKKIFLEQLVYFGDMQNFDIIPVSKTQLTKPEEVKQFFIELVKAFVK